MGTDLDQALCGDLQQGRGPVYFDFAPTLDQLSGHAARRVARRDRHRSSGGEPSALGGASSYDSRHSIIDSVIVAVGSTVLTAVPGDARRLLPVAHAFGGQQTYLFWVLSQRFMPPIADDRCRSSSCSAISGCATPHLGLILVHTLINLPLAVLLMKSFFDDVPRKSTRRR